MSETTILRYLLLGMIILTGCATTAPQSPGALRKEAMAYSMAGMPDLAIERLSQAIKLAPEDWNNYHLRGNIYYLLKRYNEALADLTRAIDLNPGHVASLCNRGAVHEELGRYEQAIGDFSRGIELESLRKSCYNGRGMAYYKMGAYERALLDFNKVSELDSAYYYAYANASLAYERLGKKQEAIEALKKFLQYVPHDAGHMRAIDEARERIRVLEGEVDKKGSGRKAE